jgi:hypothetical protein
MACPSFALSTEPTLTRFVYYKVLTLIPVSAALVAMGRHAESLLWPVLYVSACLTHAGIMYGLKCTHCPFYKMEGTSLRCFIWWGAPKLFRPRDGPEADFVGRYSLFGMLVLTLFPMYWLWQAKVLLLTYCLGIVGLVMSIGLNECSRCLHFDCANCGVPEEIRREYRETITMEGV